MLTVYAKYGTKEKVLLFTPNNEAHATLLYLESKFGGQWLKVDSLRMNEGLKFEDNTTYLGFDGVSERYSDSIFLR